MNLLEQVRRDISKLEDRGLANMSDLQLLTNLLISEKHLAERKEDKKPEAQKERSFDRDINALYSAYLSKRKTCLNDMNAENNNMMVSALHELLEEITDLICAVYKSAILPEERKEIVRFYDEIKQFEMK